MRALILAVCLAALVACGGGPKRPIETRVPPAPEPAPTQPANPSVPPVSPAPPVDTVPTRPEIVVPEHAKVLYTETGWASWYGPHYNKRRSSNGETYDMDAMTAAHRTLPLNCIVRVSNVKTGETVLLRITDRGPFVGDRVIDLSKAAAQKLDVYRRGTALVKIDVLESPSPILTGGKWSVQIGPFKDAEEAAALKDKLARRYQTAKVLQFTSPVHDVWLRVRVADDDRRRCESLMREVHSEAGMYLTRMD